MYIRMLLGYKMNLGKLMEDQKATIPLLEHKNTRRIEKIFFNESNMPIRRFGSPIIKIFGRSPKWALRLSKLTFFEGFQVILAICKTLRRFAKLTSPNYPVQIHYIPIKQP